MCRQNTDDITQEELNEIIVNLPEIIDDLIVEYNYVEKK
jgi:hypothetical protein